MTHEELDEFVTDQTQLVLHRYERRFGKRMTGSQEQSVSDHLWFVLIGELDTEAA